jgi:hypothetical protein
MAAHQATIILAASGPSLTPEQIRLTHGHNVLAVCNTAFSIPHASRMYASDTRWWDQYHTQVTQPARYTQCRASAKRYGLTWAGQVADNQPLDLGRLDNSGCSGSHAINLAHLLGFRTIILIGYDYQWTGGQAHHHADHPAPLRNAASTAEWLRRLPSLVAKINAAGGRIINCSGQTAIPDAVIPRADLGSVISGLIREGQQSVASPDIIVR